MQQDNNQKRITYKGEGIVIDKKQAHANDKSWDQAMQRLRQEQREYEEYKRNRNKRG